MTEAKVAKYLVEPREEASLGFEVPDIAEGTIKGFLRELEGVVDISDEPECDMVGVLHVTVYHQLESVPGAPSASL